MVEKFPKLKAGQFALLRADSNTGIILDELFKYSTTTDQKNYTIYDSLAAALEGAKLIFLKRKDIDCSIYDRDNKLIHFLNVRNIDSVN